MQLKWTYGAGDDFQHARAVRRAVFVEEQGFSEIGEFDKIDRTAWHVTGFENGRPVCTARLFAEAESGELHVGRMAVLPAVRGKGVGLAVMDAMAQKAKELGAKTIVLNAQADKTAFYARAGYTAFGPLNDDEGVPHQHMRREL